MTRKRVAIVGLDHYHTAGWVQSLELFADELEIVGIYDPDPSLQASLRPRFQDPHFAPALAEEYRLLPYHTDLRSLIDDCEPEIALVTLPNRDAPAALLQLVSAGIHLLTDKPGARNASELQVVVDVARNNGIRIATGLLRRYGRGWQAARSLVGEGRVGRLFSTETVFNTSSPWVRDPANPIFSNELQGGGILMWLGIHDVDLLLWLTGERIVEVQAMSAQANDAGIDVEDAISVSVRYESGAIGTIHYAYVLPRTLSEGYLALRGKEGAVTIANDGTVKWIGAGDRSSPVREEIISSTSATMPGYGSLAPQVIADLLNAIEGDREPIANGQGMVDALHVIDAIYEAAATGTRIDVRW